MQRRHRTAHTRIWLVLGIALPVMLVGMLMLRQTTTPDLPAIQLDPPPAATGESQ